MRGNRGFLAPGVSLNLSLLDNEPAYAGLSLRGKFPFPTRSGDRFYDWVMGLQFEPDSATQPWVETFFPGSRDWRRILTTFAVTAAIFEPASFEMSGTGLRLFRTEAERLELLAPSGRQIAEPLDADAAGQATFYGGFD